MSSPVRVALLGFSSFERSALAACFKLTGERCPNYEQVTDLDAAALLVADADHAPSVQLVQVTERVAHTVFIGAQPSEAARAWLARPIDPLHVMRELDVLAARQMGVGVGVGVGAVGPDTLPVSPHAMARVHLPGAAAAPVLRALLVDDSAIATLFLQRCLQPFALHIAMAATSRRATLLLSQQRFDFIFLDVELGEDSPMDGLALCQQIRRHTVHAGEVAPVVVMVSAHNRELDRVRGTLAGCDAYLGKPLQKAVLEKLMRRHRVFPAQLAPAAGD